LIKEEDEQLERDHRERRVVEGETRREERERRVYLGGGRKTMGEIEGGRVKVLPERGKALARRCCDYCTLEER